MDTDKTEKRENTWLKNHSKEMELCIQWFTFGILASLLPFLLVWLDDLTSIANRSLLNYLLDLFVIVTAISVNAINLAIDNWGKLTRLFKLLGIIFFSISLVICSFNYANYYKESTINEIIIGQYKSILDSICDSSEEVEKLFDGTEYEESIQQLVGMKQMVEKLSRKQNAHIIIYIYLSIVIIIACIFGFLVECNHAKKKPKKFYQKGNQNGQATLPGQDAQNSPGDDTTPPV